MPDRYEVEVRDGRVTNIRPSGGGCCATIVVIGAVIAMLVFFAQSAVSGVQRYFTYGTFDQTQAVTYATATVQAPILAKPDYYASLAKAAKISVGSVKQFNYQNESGSESSVYFHITLQNNDSAEHAATVLFRFTVRKVAAEYNEDVRIPVEFQEDYTLPAGQASDEKVVWQGPFGYDVVLSAVQDFRTDMLTIDSRPTRDPQTTFSFLAVKTILVSPPQATGNGTWLQCRITVSNADAIEHTITGETDVTYSYLDTGDTVTQNDSYGFFNETAQTIAPHTAVGEETDTEGQTANDQNSIVQFSLRGDPNQIVSFTITQIKITLQDPGDDAVPPSLLVKTFTPTGCNYTKPK